MIMLRWRDPLQERVAATQMRDFFKMLYKREPTAEELKAGPPSLLELRSKLLEEGLTPDPDDSMGLPPLLPIAAVVGGAFGLSSLFSYLAGRESGAHREAGITAAMAREVRDWKATARAWAVPAGLALLVGGAAVFWLNKRYSIKAAKAGAPRITVRTGEPKALPAKSEMRQNPEDEDEPEEIEPEEIEPTEIEPEEPEVEDEGDDEDEE